MSSWMRPGQGPSLTNSIVMGTLREPVAVPRSALASRRSTRLIEVEDVPATKSPATIRPNSVSP